MDLPDWLAGAGIGENPYRDAEWLSGAAYVWRTNRESIIDISNSFFSKESQIMLVVGDFGLGKGALKHAVMNVIKEAALEKQRKVEFIILEQAEWTKLQLYRALAKKLGVGDDGDTYRVRSNIEAAIQSRVNMKIEPLVIIDDAHYLKSGAYDAVKHISDLESDGKKVCPVLLLGYYKVVEELKKGDLAQVADRIHLRRKLNLFTQRDLLEYVARTLQYGKGSPLPVSYEFPIQNQAAVQAEYPKLEPFTVKAVTQIYQLSRNPRLVRLICAESFKVQAKGADAVKTPDRFNVTSKVINQAWEAIKLREEAREN